jgi:hypothetical protein
MTTKQQKGLTKGVIFSLLICLILLLSWYGPRPFSVLGPWGDNLGKFYARRRRLARFRRRTDIVVLAGVVAGTHEPDAAMALIKFLSSLAAAIIIKDGGMEPGQ